MGYMNKTEGIKRSKNKESEEREEGREAGVTGRRLRRGRRTRGIGTKKEGEMHKGGG